MSAQPVPHLSPEQYLEIENRAEYKSEYYQGVMWPLGGEPFGMAGGRSEHNIIALNIGSELRMAVKGRCVSYSSDMRIRVRRDGLYTYADASVVCGEPELADARMTLLNPRVIVEVLSKTTEAGDRGFKFSQYRRIASLREYVLVSQYEPCLEVYRRVEGDDWSVLKYSGLDASAHFDSLGCSIPLAEIYRDVQF